MGTHKMAAEVLTASFGYHVNGDTGGIAGDDAAGFAVLLYFFKNLLFDVQALNDGFEDKVAILNSGEIVLEVPRADQPGAAGFIQAGSLAFNCAL